MSPLAARADDAATVAGIYLHYARSSRSLAQAALAGATPFREWRHHPASDAVDGRRGTRFYYHAHAAAERMPGEHGHFHVFAPSPADGGPGFVHLAGLSLDDRGRPLRWFTTNGWVTGEDWLPARRVAALVAGFHAEVPGRLAPVGRWLAAMVRLHAGGLAGLLAERDRSIRDHARASGTTRRAAWQDRRLHVASQMSAALPATSTSNTAAPSSPAPTQPPVGGIQE